MDVAEAQMNGEVGAKIQQSQTQQNVAKIDAESKVVTAQRQGKGKEPATQAKVSPFLLVQPPFYV